jgi:hypothetical protein
MLRIRLREHHQLDVGRIAVERAKCAIQIIDLVRRQREAEPSVRVLECGATFRQKWNGRERAGLEMGEQATRIRKIAKHRFGHAIVDQPQKRLAIVVARFAAIAARDAISDTTLDSDDGVETTVVRYIGGFRRPRRNRAGARYNEE